MEIFKLSDRCIFCKGWGFIGYKGIQDEEGKIKGEHIICSNCNGTGSALKGEK